jgi:Zn-dependent M28 family amino/carboxypeptidase
MYASRRCTLRALPLFLTGSLLATACGPRAPVPPTQAASPGAPAVPGFPAVERIRSDDLREDLFALAGDHTRGREAATTEELEASMWLAERARAAGLEPAGENGTWFQWFPLRRLRQSETSQIVVGTDTLRLWRDAAVLALTRITVDAPVVWLGAAYDTSAVDVAGKVAAVQVRSGANAPRPENALAVRRYVPNTINTLARPLLARGAAAVVVVADPQLDALYHLGVANNIRGSYAREEGQPLVIPSRAPTLLVRSVFAPALSRAGAHLEARLVVDHFTYPSVNVIGRVPGTDPALRGQFVLFSGHQDHDGVRAPVAGDSTWNGADDNATVSVALLAIARAFAAEPGKRSALFVWHGAEEKGLHGSYWHVAHPVVPRDSIVAVLNGDMIGRNHPDTAALLGSIPPHRSSTDLVGMALEANRLVSGFAIDSTWDRPEHNEGWFFRSDHLPYARANIPSLFFTTLLHEDYHTPFDNPERIDIDKLTRVTRWMYGTGWLAANAVVRPRLDPGFRLER